MLSGGRSLIFQTIRDDEGVVNEYKLLLRDKNTEKETLAWTEERFSLVDGLTLDFGLLHNEIASSFEDEREVTVLIAANESQGVLISLEKKAGRLSRPIRHLSSFWKNEQLEAWSLSGHDRITYDSGNPSKETFLITEEGFIEGVNEDNVIVSVVEDLNDSRLGSSNIQQNERSFSSNEDTNVSGLKSEREEAVPEKKPSNLPWIIAGVLLLGILLLLLKIFKGNSKS